MTAAITPEELARVLNEGDDDKLAPRDGRVHVFDLRSAEAFAAGHLPGARHVPHAHALRWIPQRALTQELVILVDEAGERSGAARHTGHELAHHWFRRVRFLEGGFAAWEAAGSAVEKGGPTGTGANSHDGTTKEFHNSGTVPWRVSREPGTPDPTRAEA